MTENTWYVRRKLMLMDLRLERLTLERTHMAELLELLETVNPKERPFTFAKRRAEIDVRHKRELAGLDPGYKGPPRNRPRHPDLVDLVHKIVVDNPGISRQEIVAKLSDPRAEGSLTNVLSTLRRRGKTVNCGTRKHPRWHATTN